VLVPGIGVSSNYFERLAFCLNEFGPVHALDLPGFGGVPHPRGEPMTIAKYAELVGRVIDELELVDPIVVGHSMGTQIVAELATSRQLQDLVLISPVVNPHERRARTAALRFLQSSRHEPPKVVAVVLYAYLLCGPRWFSRVLPQMMRYRIEDALPKITANTLVIVGTEDALCPKSWAQEVADLLPQAQVWQIPDAAHSVMHRNAEDVARLCVDHAKRSEPDDDVVRMAEHHDETEPDPGLAETVQSIRGRVGELAGIITDDDETMAAGKTKHAEAAKRAAEAEPERTGD
jgi:pimeloyl-ACP methyl ester carboxylesterase